MCEHGAVVEIPEFTSVLRDAGLVISVSVFQIINKLIDINPFTIFQEIKSRIVIIYVKTPFFNNSFMRN